ncbi:MAG: hypothetical protein HS114_34610 [Anaerolineales bacterium]|nr:hypothetical protein [Anaerolineales bacterium]
MNELTKELLEAAWQDLKPNRRTLDALKCEVGTDWVIWRNCEIEKWAVEILPYVQRRPASDYYWDAAWGDFFYGWINRHGFYDWELPICDGEDDDFVYGNIAHCLALMAWLSFEEDWPHLDYTDQEIEEFFNFKMNYAPRPNPKMKKVEGSQLAMF